MSQPGSRGTRPPASPAVPGGSASRPGRRGLRRCCTSPLPKNCFQSAVDERRARSAGCRARRATSPGRAASSRPVAGPASAAAAAGNAASPAATISPLSSCQLPRRSTRITRGCLRHRHQRRRLAVAALQHLLEQPADFGASVGIGAPDRRVLRRNVRAPAPAVALRAPAPAPCASGSAKPGSIGRSGASGETDTRTQPRAFLASVILSVSPSAAFDRRVQQ